MTKLQTWNAAQAIINELGLTNKAATIAIAKFEALLAPKKSGGSRPEPIIFEDEEYKYCRFTGLYFPKSELVFQNDEARDADKDKGYSNIGISIWNKGQKYLKDLKYGSVEIAYGDDQSDEMLIKGREMHQEAKELTDSNSMNNYVYLMEHFLTEEQQSTIDSLELPTL